MRLFTEDGIVEEISPGTFQYMSYDTMAGGSVFFILVALISSFITSFGAWIVSHWWLSIFPIIILTVIRTLIFDIDLPIVTRIITIILDLFRTSVMYAVPIKFLDYLVNAHWLDRAVFSIIGFLAIGVIYAFIIHFLGIFRQQQLTVVHWIICAGVGILGLAIVSSFFSSIVFGPIGTIFFIILSIAALIAFPIVLIKSIKKMFHNTQNREDSK